jgi:hypothetical protein
MWKDHHYDNADMPFTMGGDGKAITFTLRGSTTTAAPTCMLVLPSWHCQKEGTGCKCICDTTFECKPTHHHTSGYKLQEVLHPLCCDQGPHRLPHPFAHRLPHLPAHSTLRCWCLGALVHL